MTITRKEMPRISEVDWDNTVLVIDYPDDLKIKAQNPRRMPVGEEGDERRLPTTDKFNSFDWSVLLQRVLSNATNHAVTMAWVAREHGYMRIAYQLNSPLDKKILAGRNLVNTIPMLPEGVQLVHIYELDPLDTITIAFDMVNQMSLKHDRLMAGLQGFLKSRRI